MGIQNFSSVFAPTDEVKKDFRRFAGKKIAVDASMEIHRALRGTKSINQLTAADGSHTQHINVLLHNILERMEYGITDIWVFDNPQENVYKKEEMETRKIQREKYAQAMIESADDLVQYSKYEKSATPMKNNDVNDIKYMLELLGIEWVEAPVNIEAEKICALLDADFVLSSDSDALVYGARNLIKRCLHSKSTTFQLYNLGELLRREDITQDELIKISILLGTDHNKGGRKGIGAKTVLNKFRKVDLTAAEQDIYRIFASPFDVSSLEWHRAEPDYKRLIDWLVEAKSFNRKRMESIFSRRLKIDV